MLELEGCFHLINTASCSRISSPIDWHLPTECKRPPRVFAASGKPLHFLAISLPNASKCETAPEFTPLNASLANNFQQSSSLITFKRWEGMTVCVTFATSSPRVVTTILLPCSTYRKGIAVIYPIHCTWCTTRHLEQVEVFSLSLPPLEIHLVLWCGKYLCWSYCWEAQTQALSWKHCSTLLSL